MRRAIGTGARSSLYSALCSTRDVSVSSTRPSARSIWLRTAGSDAGMASPSSNEFERPVCGALQINHPTTIVPIAARRWIVLTMGNCDVIAIQRLNENRARRQNTKPQLAGDRTIVVPIAAGEGRLVTCLILGQSSFRLQ